MMAYWQELTLVLVGIIAGFLNVMAGGGSLLSVPIMLFMGLPGPVANGTNRIAILAQNITAISTFFKRGFSDFKLSFSLALCSLPGAIAGAYIGSHLDGVWFNRTLALIMFLVMLLMLSSKKQVKPKPHISKRRILWAHLLMIAAGAYGGFIQVGVGFVLMPILHRVLGLDLVRVNMHKVFIVAMYTTVALIVYAVQVEIFWIMGMCLAVGNSIGGYLGAHYSIKKGEKLIKTVLNIVLSIFIVKLLFFS